MLASTYITLQTASHLLIPFHFPLSDSDFSTWTELDPATTGNLWIVTSITLGFVYVASRIMFLRFHVQTQSLVAMQSLTCFAMQRHLQLCEYSSTLEGRCVCPFSVCSFIGTYLKLYDHASCGHSDKLQMIECGETISGGGELIVVDRLIKPPGAHFNVRYISPNVPGMENFSWKLTVRSECTFSQLPPEPFVVPSFMGPATELLILINRVESVV
ncbi:hypothetical protein Bca52824_023427 [Brassica carinata]|uniref:Uncharacterized protein n=1 Tax=Brassica carinata TaxID=52824 RepID=A0A8X7VI83_BRACI|nr:hypothetical protein Bca52824_023427 [Brassica carinata]